MTFSSRDAMSLSSGLACGGLFATSLALAANDLTAMAVYGLMVTAVAMALAILSLSRKLP